VTGKNRHKQFGPAFAVVRYDAYLEPVVIEPERLVTVKEVFLTSEEAEAEAERLNALQRDRGVRYFAQSTRLKQYDREELERAELAAAKAILKRMLERGFPGSEHYLAQLDAAELTRHATGCSIAVERSRAAPAPFDQSAPAARLPIAAGGHGGLLIYLHAFEGYLDDMQLLNAARVPDPATVRLIPE
jgi:hypothetical protein